MDSQLHGRSFRQMDRLLGLKRAVGIDGFDADAARAILRHMAGANP